MRHYERKGLLASPPRTAGGYRRYPSDAVARVRLIRRALVIGFSLNELSRVLRERASGEAPCQKVRGIVQTRLDALNQQLEDLKVLKGDLETMLDDWDQQLARTRPGERAFLLDRLSARTTPSSRPPRP